MSRLPSRFLAGVLLAIGAAFFTQAASAHEYWFEPATFFPAPGQSVPVKLYVGDGLVKDLKERPYQPAHTPKFVEVTKAGTRDLRKTSMAEGMPVHRYTPGSPGNTLLGMERSWFHIKLEPAKFEDYLREDGIEYILAQREARGEGGKQGRERYSRYIKSLLQVGNTQDDTYKRNLGMKLELTPLENPYAKKIGDSLAFTVTFEGKPLVGRTVFANNRDAEVQRMTTDAQGRVTMRIERAGLWLVRLVYMQRCPADCGEADWESYWGAFSFGAR